MAATNAENATQVDATNGIGKDKKSSDPLFGPSIGPVSNGPTWTLSNEKKIVTDELTPDIVNGWIEKSKQTSQPTTTLQALVNLKRPTLRLSPLTSISDDSHPETDQHHHGLEFEYDCDAPKCGIYVNVHLPKTHPDALPTSSSHTLSKLLVFETVVDGGFGNHLKLEEGALLELGRFEHSNPDSGHISEIPRDAPSPSDVPAATTTVSSTSPADVSPNNSSNAHANHQRRRFTHFHFRKRSQNRSISGPALAVVDAEPAGLNQENKKDGKDDSSSPEEGVKVTIRLAALDEQGTELVSPNEQTTYLHIVRVGQKSSIADGQKHVEDTRPWVVKVVKREATIGPHTFHLHEIFGLTSTTHTTPAPTAPVPALPHTYPPDEPQPHPGVTFATPAADDEEPQSECLLCLSSPREVVLLPCRHLVACKECALNMVEFGAGGNITQQIAETPTGGDEAAGGVTGTNGPTSGGAAAATPAPTNPRRKRKAKGWFCPVCRQPYTSMLRLTTASPPVEESKEGEGSGTEDEGLPTVPAPAITAGSNNNTNDTSTAAQTQTTEVRSGGLLGGALRPGFLRGLSLSRPSQSQLQPPDVENQTAQVRA